MASRSSSKGKGKRKDDEDSEAARLQQARQKKRSKFAWLAKFLSRGRPSKKELVDKNILKAEPPEENKQNLYFGISPEVVYDDESRLVNGIPKPLWFCAEALEPWLIIEGVFRVSGIFSEMNRMKQTFEDGGIPDFAKVDSKHSISGLLELWFRELPEPITTHKLYDEFMQIAEGDLDGEEKLQAAKNVVAKLPRQNIEVLGFFLRVLKKVANLEHENKMGAHNLGVVFGSIFLGTDALTFSLAMKQKLNDQSAVVEYLIDNCFVLFPRDDDVKEEKKEGKEEDLPPPPEDGEAGSSEDSADDSPPEFAPPPI